MAWPDTTDPGGPGKPQIYRNEPQQFNTGTGQLQLSTLTNPTLSTLTNPQLQTMGN
jgi:hypothetical protein